MQRVVVTGLGAITPLGVGKWLSDVSGFVLMLPGVRPSWRHLLSGRSGIISLKGRKELEQQQCRVAGLVPIGESKSGGWTTSEWLSADVGSSHGQGR